MFENGTFEPMDGGTPDALLVYSSAGHDLGIRCLWQRTQGCLSSG